MLTSTDYLHLTKRFGIIGASQFPLHYLLAVRSPYSPLQLITRLSHEELKAAHQVLGRIIIFLFALHAGLYINFFVVANLLEKRIKDQDVIFGFISLVFFSIISTTALGPIRRWNYRLFYNTHIAIATAVIVSLWFHVSHIRIYIYQTLAVYVLANVLRFICSRRYQGSIKIIHGTNLLQVRIPLKPGDRALKWKPGQHVYLARALSKYPPNQKANPFTVASIPAKDNELLLVARILNGTTKQLADWSRSLSGDGSSETRNVTFSVEGPYGASLRMPDFSTFDHVLFIAGGVGATYIHPLYRTITEAGNFNHEKTHVRYIWAVRKLAETQWAFQTLPESRIPTSPPPTFVEVFVTQPSGPNLQAFEAAEDEFELEEDEGLLAVVEEMLEKPREGVTVKEGRPDISAVVSDVCGNEGRIAVFVCGPERLSGEVSQTVERWVYKGHDIYFHDETFGW